MGTKWSKEREGPATKFAMAFGTAFRKDCRSV